MWKKFRAKILKDRGCKCELCGSVKDSQKALDLHHVYPGYYDDLDPAKFALLCTSCHEFIEHIGVRWATGGVPNEGKMMVWLDHFIPRIVRTIDKYMTKESMLTVDSFKK